MTPERWAQIEELFHRAAECDPEQRIVLLDQACSTDSELRHDVEALLACGSSESDHVQAVVLSKIAEFSFSLTGEVVSHYRLLEGLGGGGMGVVYQAEDIKLGRRVAIKFLPEESATDPAALARFEREARSASALEHPNICPIYEFGEHHGRPFLVMPLLEGQTLRELLETKRNLRKSKSDSGTTSECGPNLSLDQTLDLAIQIAGGLEAAHLKGIIHRDIKPANIFVTSHGEVKILDFGLAKLVRDAAGEDDESEGEPPRKPASMQPIELFLSQTGVAIGTAGYMSPEQARGEKLDVRTDLFSLGLVLHEMATGQRTPKLDTTEVLREALKDTPTLPAPMPSIVPAKLGQIINKALEHDREARFQTAGEIRTDLQRLKTTVEHGTRWPAFPTAVLVMLMLIAAVFWFYERHQASPQTRPAPKLTQLTVNSFENSVVSGAVSPNGKYLAYSDVHGMYIKFLDTGETHIIPQPNGLDRRKVQWEVIPSAWFPDSTRFLANTHRPTQDPSYWSSDETSFWIVSVSGGEPMKVRDKATGYSVSPDGSLISFAVNDDREMWLMPLDGANTQKLMQVPKGNFVEFSWTPDGHRVVYSTIDEAGVTLLSRELGGGPAATLLTPSDTNKSSDYGLLLPDGRVLYSQREAGSVPEICNYWSMRVDPRTGQRFEKPVQLTRWAGSCGIYASVTADGRRLAFVKSLAHMTSYMAEVAAGGRRLVNLRHFPLTESSDSLADWTGDSKQLVLVSNRSGDYGVYMQPLDEETATPLVTEGYGRNPRVTPGGKHILYLGLGDAAKPLETRAQPVMRVPIGGGAPQHLFTANPMSMISCARAPSELRAIAEPTEDHKEVIINALDPFNGRGPELGNL